jgi:high-affinity nickel-transport protein
VSSGGSGQSLTLLVVGGAIVFFGIVIPERLGLSLEFCVALMLILLGALNLRRNAHTAERRSRE